MKRLLFLSVFAYLTTIGGGVAGGGNNVQGYDEDWGGGHLIWCGRHALGANNACIGATRTCTNRTMYARDWTDEWAVQMLVAMKVNANGAYFCPVQIEGKNKNKGNAWTEYAAAGSNCVWLCKEGFTGDNCVTPAESSTSCDPTKLSAATYSSLRRIVSGPNIEDKVAMFKFNANNGCGLHKRQEHDIILGVTRWTPSGHGAFVRQLIVRAERSGWRHMDSWANIYPADDAPEILTCKNGYKPNVSKTDCDEINLNICAQAMACDGWSNAGFDEEQHVMVMPEGKKCYEFRCSQTGYAFKSESDRTCAECATSLLNGVNSKTGMCVQCEIGKIFDAETNSCADTTWYIKADLQYGRGQTKASQPDVSKQCWTFAVPEEYTVCVTSGGQAINTPTSDTEPARAARVPVRR